tara:strand:+ start:640 stop:1131 length:492 start_codon:yes stop_codon:yes gene_type:complete
MHILKLFAVIFLSIAVTRYLPHPPNFTSLVALSFYIPVVFGIIYIPLVLISFVITDVLIGFHNILFFTWGSTVIIGLFSRLFISSGLKLRITGALTGAVLFFIITNFGVWLTGSYGYTIKGIIDCYTMAIPFFGYTLISTLMFVIIIEIIIKITKTKLIYQGF